MCVFFFLSFGHVTVIVHRPVEKMEYQFLFSKISIYLHILSEFHHYSEIEEIGKEKNEEN